jgi:hypothetical protein
MDDQKNIRDMRLRLKNEEEEREAKEKLMLELKQLAKDHIARLDALHRNSKGCKW